MTRIFISLFFFVSTVSAFSAEKTRILASIGPLGLIAQEVGGDLVSVDLLSGGAASPHHFHLKMSHKRKIQQADLVFWVGPALEPFLKNVVSSKKSLQLSELEPFKKEIDPHYWVGPQKSLQIAQALADRLRIIHPSHQDTIERRLAKFKQSVLIADQELVGLSASVPPFFVFHDGLHYFVKHYGLRQAGALTEVPEEQIGVKTLKTLVAQKEKGECLIAEDGEAIVADKYAKRMSLPVVLVDLLAVRKPYKSYAEYLRTLMFDAAQCASSNS